MHAALTMFLVVAAAASPGPLDRYGGHVEAATGEYHTHAGFSYKSRFVASDGRIYEGNGPLPDENLALPGSRVGFLIFVAGTSLLTGFGAWWVNDRMRRERRFPFSLRRRRRRRLPSRRMGGARLVA